MNWGLSIRSRSVSFSRQKRIFRPASLGRVLTSTPEGVTVPWVRRSRLRRRSGCLIDHLLYKVFFGGGVGLAEGFFPISFCGGEVAFEEMELAEGGIEQIILA